jgi:hypothetical protein
MNQARKRLKDTVIELFNDSNTSATQIVTKQFQRRPVVVIGERGLVNAVSRVVSLYDNIWGMPVIRSNLRKARLFVEYKP